MKASPRIQQDWKKVSEAIAIWTGYNHFHDRLMHPHMDDSRVVAHFGTAVASQLLPLLRELYEAFYESDARDHASGLPEMAKVSSAQFKKKHPEISDEAVAALAWCYTFDYK